MNMWLWNSFEEYKERVRPIERTNPSWIRDTYSRTTAQNLCDLFQSVSNFREAIKDLETTVARFSYGAECTEMEFRHIMANMIRLNISAEDIFCHCKPLAKTAGGDDFICAKDISNHLFRYFNEHCARVLGEVREIPKAGHALLDSFHVLMEEYEKLIIGDIKLPSDLKQDFVTARNLMSIGFEEAAVIYSGRGLEGVVRRIAQHHKIQIVTNKGPKPAQEGRFVELINRLNELRFSDGTRLMDGATEHLLHYGRELRNKVAHPQIGQRNEKYREQAILMAHRADELWTKCSAPGVQLA